MTDLYERSAQMNSAIKNSFKNAKYKNTGSQKMNNKMDIVAAPKIQRQE